MSDAPLRLQTALRLPRTHRWIADWLFTNLSTPFHRNLTLPPSALQAAVSLHAKHTISLPPTFFPLPIDDTDSSKAVDIIFVPLAVHDAILVGYTLTLGVPQQDQQVQTNPFEPPFAGRFVFDTGGGEMLMVLQGNSPPVVGIMYMGGAGSVREQSTFAVPANEYGFDHLPSMVLSMFSTSEQRIHDLRDVPVLQNSSPQSALEAEQNPLELIDKLLATPAEQFESLFDPPAPVEGRSYLPWFVGGGGELSDGGTVMANPQTTDTSSGAFCVRRLSGAVRKLQKVASGKFFGPSVRMDALHLLTGRYCSTHTGRIIYNVHETDNRKLTEAFAATYFLSVLDVAPDQRLLLEADGNDPARISGAGSNEDLTTEEGGSMKRGRGSSDELVPIAPAYIPEPEERPKTPPNETKEERRVRLAVERRKRNRLSAARSNMRKKEQLEAVKKEIERNWERIKELKERRGVLEGENEQLRRYVGGVGEAFK